MVIFINSITKIYTIMNDQDHQNPELNGQMYTLYVIQIPHPE